MTRSSIDDLELEPDGIEENEFGFFAALLIRFPEIASVRSSTDDASITITFLLRERPGQAAVESFGRRLNRSLEALTRVIGDGIERTAKTRVASFETPNPHASPWWQPGSNRDFEGQKGPGGDVDESGTAIASLQVIRALQSVVAEEFNILRGMVLDSFGELVIVEGSELEASGVELHPGEGEEEYPLEYCLRRFKDSGAKGHIYGFREGARVLVYRA